MHLSKIPDAGKNMLKQAIRNVVQHHNRHTVPNTTYHKARATSLKDRMLHNYV